MDNNEKMINFLSNYVSKSELYAANVIAKISMFIYQYRQNLKMTQKEFASKMGVTQAMISKWESADYNFTIETIAQISEKLDYTFDIEFTPESEYLINSEKNQYEGMAKSIGIKNLLEEYSFAA